VDSGAGATIGRKRSDVEGTRVKEKELDLVHQSIRSTRKKTLRLKKGTSPSTRHEVSARRNIGAATVPCGAETRCGPIISVGGNHFKGAWFGDDDTGKKP